MFRTYFWTSSFLSLNPTSDTNPHLKPYQFPRSRPASELYDPNESNFSECSLGFWHPSYDFRCLDGQNAGIMAVYPMFRQNDQNDGKQSLTIPRFFFLKDETINSWVHTWWCVCFCLCKWWEFWFTLIIPMIFLLTGPDPPAVDHWRVWQCFGLRWQRICNYHQPQHQMDICKLAICMYSSMTWILDTSRHFLKDIKGT